MAYFGYNVLRCREQNEGRLQGLCSREAQLILNEISTAAHQGMINQQIQKFPYFDLIQRKF
jgi:hypothetical protein